MSVTSTTFSSGWRFSLPFRLDTTCKETRTDTITVRHLMDFLHVMTQTPLNLQMNHPSYFLTCLLHPDNLISIFWNTVMLLQAVVSPTHKLPLRPERVHIHFKSYHLVFYSDLNIITFSTTLASFSAPRSYEQIFLTNN